jgi:hypothetical protein
LFIAVTSNNLTGVIYSLENGADVKALDSNLKTPLILGE